MWEPMMAISRTAVRLRSSSEATALNPFDSMLQSRQLICRLACHTAALRRAPVTARRFKKFCQRCPPLVKLL
jgi:hypothetical protein